MAIIIICAIIGLIIGLSSSWYSISEKIELMFVGTIIGIVIFFSVGGIVGDVLATNGVVVEEQKICALNDSSNIEGRNFLFSGYIDGEMVYRYVIETDKGKHIEEIDADYGYIKEGDYTPMVKHYSYDFEKDWHRWFAHRAFVGDYYEFYVPENTVTTEYNVDLN